MLLVALIPVLLAIPQLTPWLQASPSHYVAQMALPGITNIQRGWPYIDPNNGFQTEALGFRAAQDWMNGEVPWWNPYTGIGMPLAAEYQGAAFFPLTLILLLPRGMVLLQMALQILAGLGTYCLLRQMGLSRLAAVMGGVMYGVNGTLAWFNHGPASAVPFLSWTILGIEHARVAAIRREGGGWRVLAIAMTLSLLAGFPETAYIDGLLALAWAILRGMQAPRDSRAGFSLRVVAGGTVALLVAAPQVFSFFQFLMVSNVGPHAAMDEAALAGPQILGTLIAPYFFGPIFGYMHEWPWHYYYWGALGGYASIALVVVALYAFISMRRDALALLLMAWIVSTLGKTFALEPFLTLWNIVPGVTLSAFARYAQPSWEFALVVLAAMGIDSLRREGVIRSALVATLVIGTLGMLAAAGYLAHVWQLIPPIPGMRKWMAGSAVWAIASVMVVFLLVRRGSPGATRILAILLAGEAALLCFIPILSNPRGTRLDTEAIEFLQRNLGFQRFYTLAPIQPNYGAMFGIASINHNYLPVPQAWVDYIKKNLNRTWSDPVVFDGLGGQDVEMRNNLGNFQEVGVKYVLSNAKHDPFERVAGVRRVYADRLVKVWELPNPRPYFEEVTGACRIDVVERRRARVDCPMPSTVFRREMYFDGWTVTVNRAPSPILRHKEIFQGVAVPAGASEVRFSYAPPHIGWAWLAAALGLLALLTPPSLLSRDHQ